MVSYRKTQHTKKAGHIKRDINRSLESIECLSHKLESSSRNDNNCVNGLVQACFVEIDSAILEVRRLITDLRVVSGKINHYCTSEIERVEASISCYSTQSNRVQGSGYNTYSSNHKETD